MRRYNWLRGGIDNGDMNPLLLFCSMVLFRSYIEAYENQDPQGTIYDSEEYDYTYYNKPNSDEIKSKAEISSITTPRSATYEVTEIVIDVPNTSTKLGPVITNYTTKRPLNYVNSDVKNFTDFGLDLNSNKENYGSIDDGDKDESNVKAKKNYFTIFHVNAEYDDKPNSHVYHSNHDTVPHRQGFKDYLFGIKKGIINGFNKIFHRHGYGHDDHEFRPKDFGDSHKYERGNSDEDEEFDHFRHDVSKEFD